MKVKKPISNKLILIFPFMLIAFTGSLIYYFNSISIKTYTAENFGIEILKSDTDFNNNNIDDYTDILNGAKIEAERHPKYTSGYYEGGYPPSNEGVCTDLVWRAFKNAGYCLREMVDKDIKLTPYEYPHIEKADKNIDFRRTKNLKIFFQRHAVILTNDPYEIEKWQPGDIVIYNDNHIAIVSDKRNKHGLPYIIHHHSLLQQNLEENALTNSKITRHYRFDAKLADKKILAKWI